MTVLMTGNEKIETFNKMKMLEIFKYIGGKCLENWDPGFEICKGTLYAEFKMFWDNKITDVEIAIMCQAK